MTRRDCQVASHQGLRFGGIGAVPEGGGSPAMVRIAVRRSGGEFVTGLPEGGTLRAGGQTWRIAEISIHGRRWHADLIRVG